MTCSEARNLLTAASAWSDRAARDHVATCAECQRFEARNEAARAYFRDHHLAVEPGPHFATRVLARLDGPEDEIRWAAIRLLPAALTLALVLAVIHGRHVMSVAPGASIATGTVTGTSIASNPVASSSSSATAADTDDDAASDPASDDVLLWVADASGGGS